MLAADGPQAAPIVAWATSVGGPVRSSPVVVRNTVIIGGGDGIYALNAATGAVKWKFPLPKGSQSSACVVDDVVYIGADNGTLLALNLADGKPRWRARVMKNVGTNDFRTNTSPAFWNGLVLAGFDDGCFYAFDAGKLLFVGCNDGKVYCLR